MSLPWTLPSAFGHVSLRTTSRYLPQIRYLRSDNHNGHFYTLCDPARFDRFGLFSRDGSLTNTVRRLVSESAHGFTPKELSGLLHVSVRPFLLAAVRQHRARRERLGGVYVPRRLDRLGAACGAYPIGERPRTAPRRRAHAGRFRGPAGGDARPECRRRNIPDLLSHLHFLGAVGHKLLDGHYGMLRSRISRSKVRSQLRALLCQARSAGKVRPDVPALLLRLLEDEGRKHLPHPFSLPHLAFARRCERLPAQRDLHLPRPRTRVEHRMLRQAAVALANLRRLDPKAQLSARLEQDQLPRGTRAAAPLAPAAAAARLQAIATDLRSLFVENGAVKGPY